MKFIFLCFVWVGSAGSLFSQSDPNDKLAPNTFPNSSIGARRPVAPRDSIEAGNYNTEASDEIIGGTNDQDTTLSAYKGLSQPRRKKAEDSGDQSIIISGESNDRNNSTKR